MNINLYFLDKSVTFTDEADADNRCDAVIAADDSVTRAKVLKILESCNRLAVLTNDPEAAFDRFGREFVRVDAAGGVVADPEGNILMILRRGRWDLPKGHIEPGEEARICACREVAEETGIGHTKVGAAICSTYHSYELCGRRELKRTQWFAMTSDGEEQPMPQHEEGIERVEWVLRSELGSKLAGSFPTIREVFESFGLKV